MNIDTLDNNDIDENITTTFNNFFTNIKTDFSNFITTNDYMSYITKINDNSINTDDITILDSIKSKIPQISVDKFNFIQPFLEHDNQDVIELFDKLNNIQTNDIYNQRKKDLTRETTIQIWYIITQISLLMLFITIYYKYII